MNRFVSISALSISMFLSVFFSVHAESTSTASSSPSLIESVIENVTALKETIVQKEPSSEDSPVLTKATQKRIINLAANISNRFDAIIWRFENISTRLQKRIEVEKTNGYNVDSAQASLTNANTAIAAAKANMSNIDVLVYDAVTSKNPKTDWAKVKMRYKETRELIKTAYQELKNTVSNLKNLGQAPSETSTSTPTTT